jgi:hypothetical protein
MERFKFAEPGNFDQSLEGMVLGAKWDKSEDPTLVRTDGAVGLIAQAGVDDEVVINDFDQMPIFGEMHDVVDHLGNEFVRIPKFYIRKVDEPGLKSWQISKTQRDGYYLPACFYDFELDTELDYIDVGKYNASLGIGDVLESKPNAYPLVSGAVPGKSATIVALRDYARANNNGGLRGYQQMDIHVYDVLSTLFYVEFATLNSQAVMYGFANGAYSDSHTAVISETNTNRVVLANTYAANYRVGQAISAGTARGNLSVFYGRTITAIEDYDVANKSIVFDGDPVTISEGNVLWNSGWRSGFSSKIAASSGSIGSNTGGKYPCMYRGIENPWGSVYQWVDGVNINDHQAWVCRDAAQYASNVFAHPYEQLSYVNHNENGYPTEMGHDPDYPFAEFPVAIQTSGISSAKYYCDYYYQSAGQRVAFFGGYWVGGTVAGLSCWDLDSSAARASVGIGGRLLKKPL